MDVPHNRPNAAAGWPRREVPPRRGQSFFKLTEKDSNMLGTILIVVLVLMFLGTIPTWGHSRSWGYRPSGAIGLILLILIVMVLTGRL